MRARIAGWTMAAALLLVAAVAWSAPATRAPVARAPAVDDAGWPGTAVGKLARRWTEAFSSGEKAMRETLPQVLSAESLAKRSMELRMETYRAMRERLGSLMLASVDSSGVGELKVTLATSNLSQVTFIFTAAPGPPPRLARVSMVERRGGHGH